MLRRMTSYGTLLALVVLCGCGGGDAPAPTATTGGAAPPPPPQAAPTGPSAAPATQPAASDVYALVPDSATGALAIRPQKLLASPFAQSEAVKKFKDEMRSQNGMEVEQLEEVIIVFTGTGSSSAYGPTSPYGGERRETGPPPAYGPSNSPYGPSLTTQPSANAGSQQAAMAALGPMMPSSESVVAIFRAAAPFDRAKIIELAKVDPTETESGQFKYHKAKEANEESICFFDDRTLLAGRETTLQGFFTPAAAAPSASPYGPAPDAEETEAAPAGSKLGEKLRTAAPELALHGSMKFGGLQLGALPPGTQTPPGMDPSAMMSAMAATIPGGAFSIDLTSGAKLVIDLEAASADAAQQMWVNLQSAQGTINALMGVQRAATPPNQTPEQKELREKGFAAWDQFSKTMKVEKGGEGNLHVLVSGSLDQPMVESLAAMMKRDLFVPPGSPQALALVQMQMKQIGLAAHNYLAEKSKLPTAAILSADGKPLLSWRVALLPYLGQKELFDQFKLDEPWDSEHNKALIEKMPEVYSIPGVNEPGKTTLVAPIGDKTVFGHKEGATLVMASDGAGNTILLVQANPDKAVTWTAPDDLPFDAAKPTAGLDKTYPGVFLALWLDGAVHSIALDTAKATAAGLFTYAGGETIDLNALIAAAETAATRPADATGADATATANAGEKTYEEGWAGDARRAVDLGHDKEAARLALAAALVLEDEALAKDVMHFAKLGTNKPVYFLRFGLGAMPDPKRRKETNTTSSGFGEFNRASGSSSGEDEEADPQKQFDDLAGEVGREMIKELRDMLDDGQFGALFEYERQKTDDGGGTSNIEAAQIETGRSPYGPTSPTSSSAAPGTPNEVAEKAPRGLIILGSGDRKKLQDAAAEAEVDVLLIAEMTTKNNRSTDPAVQFTLTDVATKKRFAQSDPIPLPSNGSSASPYGGTGNTSAGGANNDAESRRANLAKWVKTLESALKFKEIPTLPADKVLTQATKVVGAGKQKNPLPLLLELRYYQALGALKPEDALPLVQKVVGDEAKAQTLVNGTTEERKAVIKEYLLEVPDAPASSDDES